MICSSHNVPATQSRAAVSIGVDSPARRYKSAVVVVLLLLLLLLLVLDEADIEFFGVPLGFTADVDDDDDDDDDSRIPALVRRIDRAREC